MKLGSGTHSIPIDELNCFTFSFDSVLPDVSIPPINEQDVPQLREPHLKEILKKNIAQSQNLFLQRIIDFVDNLNTVQEISEKSQSKLDHVLEALQHLIYYDIIIIKPLFKFTDRYHFTFDFRNLL